MHSVNIVIIFLHPEIHLHVMIFVCANCVDYSKIGTPCAMYCGATYADVMLKFHIYTSVAGFLCCQGILLLTFRAVRRLVAQ